MIVNKNDANLISTIFVIFMSIFNSTANFPAAICYCSYMFWATEALQSFMGKKKFIYLFNSYFIYILFLGSFYVNIFDLIVGATPLGK